MVPQIAITGSGSSSVSPAQSSASAGSSFTDLLQSMVPQSSTHSSGATHSHIEGSGSKPVQPADTTHVVDSDELQKMSEKTADKDPVSGLPTSDSRTEKASQEPNSVPAVKTDSADTDKDSDASVSSKEHKDNEDPLAGLTLLSAIPASVQPVVVPLNAAIPETGNGDVASAAGSAGEVPTGPVTPFISDNAGTQLMTGATAVNAGVAGTGAESAVPADAADADHAAVSGGDKDFSQVLNAAAGNATSANSTGKDAPAGEPVNKVLSPTAQTATPEKSAHAAVPQTEPANDKVSAPFVNSDTANATPVQSAADSATRAAASTPAIVEAGKTAVQEAGQKTQAAERMQTTADRAKERASSRQSEDSESGTKLGSKDSTQFSAVSVDTNSVVAMHGSKGSETAPQQDVPLQQTMAVDSHSGKANDSRSVEPGASSSLSAATSAASSAVHTPDTSWMSSVRLMERVSQSEMRVGIQSELGDIAVRTAMNRHGLSAEISVQHAGLRDAIMAEIPALQSRLSTQQIPSANVSVTADAGGGANNPHQSAQDGRPAGHYSATANNNDSSITGHEPVAPVEVLGRSAGLDIRI